ncbi:MAG: MBL fold metallo-hydrolase RNA specificity domain-containing protein, partial [Shewanella indica]
RLLVDGASELTINGNSVNVAARIHTVGGLSAHADQAELLRWYREFEGAPPLILVHGEPDAQRQLLSVLEHADGVQPKPRPQASAIATEGDKLDLSRLPELSWVVG